ncbi:tetratricopeptide repeat protein (plasmid) [Clostridium estertheticum]|uniref:tetratricopeptide repeat protein n=1 Tax=Clostridium estertheticum TaxID=238834 RepID=UPI001C0D387C|nr:tetratricopeptide repeat protein [Clostridium estertheticum]MBU3202318.1 tetratricopeptide repeat protein [Clostridium estertheticum]WAG68153.1 tetratricopeptide repeat protein [Clostridium estertheticum]
MYKFDPHMKESNDLKLTFISGKKYLEDFLEDLKPKNNKLTSQSFLLVGQRGSGKSHFMKMMYYSIKKNDVLSKSYIPILFSEDIYVTSMYHFLRDSILRIFNEISNSKVFEQKADMYQALKELEEDFKEANIPLVKMSKSEQLIERAQQQKKYFVIIREIYKITKCKIIFIVENLQDLFGAKFADEDLKTLRAFLIESSSPLLLICSSVTLFDKVQNYGEPFYNFFKTRRLDGLNDDEVFELLRSEILVRSKNNKEEYLKLNKRIEKSKNQIKLYNIMTNGSPRLILFLYDLILQNENLDVDNILSQITELTPYFKSEMDSLSGTKQMILSTICTGTPAQTVSEISLELTEPIGIVNENIKRLVDDGMIKTIEMEPNKEIKKSEKFYIVSDYYFRIWFQVRSATCRQDGIKWIAELAVLLFSEDDLKEKIDNCDEEFKSIYEKALLLKQDKFYNENLLSLIKSNDRNDDITNEIFELFKEENWEEVIVKTSKELEVENYNSLSFLYYASAYAYSKIEKYKEAEYNFKKVIDLELNDIAVLSDVFAELSTIYLKTHKYRLAIEILTKSININKNNVNAFIKLGAIYFELNDYKKCISTYDEAIKLGANDGYIFLDMAQCYQGLEKYKKSIECCKKTLENKKYECISYIIIAQNYRMLKEYNESVIYFKKSLELNPPLFEQKVIYRGIIASLIELKEYENAVIYGEEAIKKQCYDESIYIRMGNAYNNLKNFNKSCYYLNLYVSSKEKYFEGDIRLLNIIKDMAPIIFTEKESVAALINQSSTLNEKVKAITQLISLNKFNGIETIFAGILEELKVQKPQEELKQLYFYFLGETVLRLNNQSPEKDFLICSRYFLDILSLLYSDENKVNEKIMEFIICYASSKKEGKINSEGLKKIFDQWKEIDGTQIPDIITALFDALEDPKSRIAQVWSGDPLFNKVLKMLTD